MEYSDRGAVVVLRWRGCLSAMGYGDNGTVENLQEEADELPCCRCDDQPETASNNSSLSHPDEEEEEAYCCTSGHQIRQ
jgi:hypothetical protein